VLRHRGTLVICEVKSRTGTHLAHPAEAVTPAKAARLRRLAAVWLRESSRRRRPALGRSDFVEEFPRLGRFGRLTRLARFARVARFAALAGVPATPVGSKAGRVRARAEVAIRTSAACPPSARGRVPRPIRIDVVAVRLAPREPFPVLAIDHLIGVA
jgi:Holliday junction resolvase-like predicted endonuclease